MGELLAPSANSCSILQLGLYKHNPRMQADFKLVIAAEYVMSPPSPNSSLFWLLGPPPCFVLCTWTSASWCCTTNTHRHTQRQFSLQNSWASLVSLDYVWITLHPHVAPSSSLCRCCNDLKQRITCVVGFFLHHDPQNKTLPPKKMATARFV